MAIHEQDVAAVTVGKLLNERLTIPNYQRPYVWTPATALRLLDDIRDAQERHSDKAPIPYVLGAVILHRTVDHHDHDTLNIVDGQQRLLTLKMLLDILDGKDSFAHKKNDSPVALVYSALSRQVPSDANERQDLKDFIRQHCQVVKVTTDNLDEAFRVFDSQNYRGKPLAPHDLLKAHHLREMRDESAALKAAVVEQWESAGDKALDALFSIYLYRIAKWSRGETPTKFGTQDLDEFRGVSPTKATMPSMRYHLAAQSVIPILNAWQSQPSENSKDADRARFQLDAPILAGRSFFERTDFFLKEIQDLKNREAPTVPGASTEATDAPTYNDWLGRTYYRYVTELYLAAMLYYVNKFSDDELEQVSRRLFSWAYSLRLRLQRVMQVSVLNLGADPHSPFALMRTSYDGRELLSLNVDTTPYSESHEADLQILVNNLLGRTQS